MPQLTGGMGLGYERPAPGWERSIKRGMPMIVSGFRLLTGFIKQSKNNNPNIVSIEDDIRIVVWSE